MRLGENAGLRPRRSRLLPHRRHLTPQLWPGSLEPPCAQVCMQSFLSHTHAEEENNPIDKSRNHGSNRLGGRKAVTHAHPHHPSSLVDTRVHSRFLHDFRSHRLRSAVRRGSAFRRSVLSGVDARLKYYISSSELHPP